MYSKLTLSLDKSVIEAAKAYAKSNQISLSKLIEAYLASLTIGENRQELTPLVNSLSGVIELPNSESERADYSDFLDKKYE